MGKKKEIIEKLKQLKSLWSEISELCDEIDDEDREYALGEFAKNYPFELSFDEYPAEIEEWIGSLENAYNNTEE